MLGLPANEAQVRKSQPSAAMPRVGHAGIPLQTTDGLTVPSVAISWSESVEWCPWGQFAAALSEPSSSRKGSQVSGSQSLVPRG